MFLFCVIDLFLFGKLSALANLNLFLQPQAPPMYITNAQWSDPSNQRSTRTYYETCLRGESGEEGRRKKCDKTARKKWESPAKSNFENICSDYVLISRYGSLKVDVIRKPHQQPGQNDCVCKRAVPVTKVDPNFSRNHTQINGRNTFFAPEHMQISNSLMTVTTPIKFRSTNATPPRHLSLKISETLHSYYPEAHLHNREVLLVCKLRVRDT